MFIVKSSTRSNKKFMVIVDNKKIHFGANGMSDYPKHKDEARKIRYINRHKKREAKFWKHTKANLLRPSYWSRWYSWNLPTYEASLKFINKKFE